MVKDTDINKLLIQEYNAFNIILNQINELCEQNRKLQGLIAIQNEAHELEKEHNRSLPWFKRFAKTVSNIKYVFIKSEQQLTNEVVKHNNKILKDIDHKIHDIAEKSASLKQELQQEVRRNFDELAKKDLSTEQRNRLSILFNKEYAAKSEKFSPLTMTATLHFVNGEALENQFNSLNTIRQNIQNVISENTNIKEFKAIQQQVADIREGSPHTFFEKLHNAWQSVKNVFVDNSEKVLEQHKKSNIKAMNKIEAELSKTHQKIQTFIDNKASNITATTSHLSNDIRDRITNDVDNTYDIDDPRFFSAIKNKKSNYPALEKPNDPPSTTFTINTPITSSDLESFKNLKGMRIRTTIQNQSFQNLIT